MDTNNDSRAPTVRKEGMPAPIIPASMWRRHASQMVWIDGDRRGHVTPQNGALLQSLPADYMLPGDRNLAGTIVGNAVPSLMMRKIVQQLL